MCVIWLYTLFKGIVDWYTGNYRIATDIRICPYILFVLCFHFFFCFSYANPIKQRLLYWLTSNSTTEFGWIFVMGYSNLVKPKPHTFTYKCFSFVYMYVYTLQYSLSIRLNSTLKFTFVTKSGYVFCIMMISTTCENGFLAWALEFFVIKHTEKSLKSFFVVRW